MGQIKIMYQLTGCKEKSTSSVLGSLILVYLSLLGYLIDLLRKHSQTFCFQNNWGPQRALGSNIMDDYSTKNHNKNLKYFINL